MIDPLQLTARSKEQMELCLKRMEKVMKKILDYDANNWEAYRMLAKICTDR